MAYRIFFRKQLTLHKRSMKVIRERFGVVEEFLRCYQAIQAHTGKLRVRGGTCTLGLYLNKVKVLRII